jgi:hypothetical protein
MCGKKYVRGAWIGLLATAFLSGCGSKSSNTPNTPPPTGISKRVLISNTSTGTVNLLDANRDAITSKTFGANSPTKMVTNGGTTIVQNISAGQIGIIDNKTEAVTFTALLADIPFDIAISPDGKTAWAAVRAQGLVQQVDVATGVIKKSVTVPSASRLVMSPTGTKLLAFSDDPQTLPTNANSFFVIDTANPPATGTPIAMTAGDQPFTGVFTGSETQVFVLNCGTECGGANAPSVVRVDLTGATPNAPVAGTNPITGATVGLFDSGKLYVAGTKLATATTPSSGSLQVIDTTALTAGPAIPITDGRHTVMALSTNKHLYIGATGCTPGPVNAQNQARGCLSIFNTAAAAGSTNPVFPLQSSLRQNFDVTAFQQISGRNVMYVCQGAELDFFDITTDAVSPTIQIVDLVGKAYGLVLLDP